MWSTNINLAEIERRTLQQVQHQEENQSVEEETALTDKQMYTLVVYNGTDPSIVPKSFTTVSARQQYYESMKTVALNKKPNTSSKAVLTIGTWWPFLKYAKEQGWYTEEHNQKEFWLASNAKLLYARIRGEQNLRLDYREAMILGYMMGGFTNVFNTVKIPNQAFAKTFCDNFAASVFRSDAEDNHGIHEAHVHPYHVVGQEEEESHENDDHSESDDNRDDVVIISETPGNGIFIKEEPVYEEESTEQATQKRTQPVPTVTPEKKQKRSRRGTVKKT